jgi:hypothetical protein
MKYLTLNAENAWLQIIDSYQVPFSFSRKAPKKEEEIHSL